VRIGESFFKVSVTYGGMVSLNEAIAAIAGSSGSISSVSAGILRKPSRKCSAAFCSPEATVGLTARMSSTAGEAGCSGDWRATSATRTAMCIRFLPIAAAGI
jgi:hypothetical protein